MGAVESYQQAIALYPFYADAYNNLGIVLDEQGRFAEASTYYRQALKLQPDHLQAINNLGCVLVKQGQGQAAIDLYRQAIADYPHVANFYNNLGQAWSIQKSVEQSIAAYRRAIELDPDLVIAHHNLGKALQQQGQHLAAIAHFQQVIQREPGHEAYSDWAASLLALGKIEPALDCLRQAIAPHTEFVEYYLQWADGLVGDDPLIQARIACARWLRALQHPTPASDRYTALGETYIQIGHALMRYGRPQAHQQAEVIYQKALQLLPDRLDGYLALAACLIAQERLEAATLVYHLALTLYPNQPQIQTALGDLLAYQHRLDEAIACYDVALRSDGQGVQVAVPHLEVASFNLLDHQTTQNWDRPQGYLLSREWVVSQPSMGCYVSVDIDAGEVGQVGEIGEAPARAGVFSTAKMASCDGLNCTPCLQAIFQQFEPIQVKRGIYTAAQSSYDLKQPWPTFVVHLRQGRVWTVPQQGEWQVCHATAVLTADHILLTDVSRDYPGQLPGCQRPHPYHHAIVDQKTLPPLKAIEGRVAVINGLSGNVYFHWMIDILPRIALLQQSGLELAQIDWFLVNSDRQPFQLDTLAVLGIPATKLLQSDRYPHVQASELLVPSFPGYLGWLQPWVATFLRQTFLPLAAPAVLDVHYPERIYISRAQARHRRLFNETEIVTYLQSLGFVSICLESLSLKQQITLFAHAKVIVAPHGSGLTNIVFCQPETIVIELVSPHYIRHYYWVISQQLSLHHYYLAGESLSCHIVRELMYQNPLIEDIWINPVTLRLLIEWLGLASTN